jgi:glycosyltransferase involved in cell wall biosynthesis
MMILYIIESLKSGGKERRLIQLIKGMKSTYNIDVKLIVLNSDVHYVDVFNYNIDIIYFKRNILKDPFILWKFIKALKKVKPDIVHCWDNIAAIHFGPICKIKGVPFINSMITTAPPASLVKIYSKRFISTAISYPFSNIVLSNSKAGLLAFKVPKSKAKFIHNGFDFNRIKSIVDKNIILKKYKITTKYIVGMTASFTDKKDYYTFVQAGQLLLKKEKNITFLLIGGGPLLLDVKNSIDVKNKSNFRFVGKQKDVESFVNICNIGVLTTNSNKHGEGISNALMEYMALGKPVIATDGGGTKELIVNKETGFTIQPQNVKQLAEKINFLLDSPKEAKIMGEKGKKRIEECFSISKMVNKTLQLYKDQIK